MELTIRENMLKFLLQEKTFEYFSDDEIRTLLMLHRNIYKSAQEGCLLKAQDDSVKLSILNTPSNEDYWVRLAEHYEAKWLQGFDIDESGNIVEPEQPNSGDSMKSKVFTWGRSDEY